MRVEPPPRSSIRILSTDPPRPPKSTRLELPPWNASVNVHSKRHPKETLPSSPVKQSPPPRKPKTMQHRMSDASATLPRDTEAVERYGRRLSSGSAVTLLLHRPSSATSNALWHQMSAVAS
ncbi:Aste57867_21781 [Aphanomyces stellatus]|uniref:Aste57867_21781 protein n=1 Tax=Aphanomyces stellatus TaxID=120398 RepID=A0A485LIF9_9STRA|nr:hypothetical protein As57867_021712 [Aphanomyces stellatus]VFT98450.1 Aste57867_21781 [Aphanomyces stellatus]